MTSVSLHDEPWTPMKVLPCLHITFFFFLDIVMVVKTSGTIGAGTDAEIRIKIFGTKGSVPDKKISGRFEKGR